MNYGPKDLIIKKKIFEQIEAYNAAKAQVAEAYSMLQAAQDRLQATFGKDYRSSWPTMPAHRTYISEPKDAIDHVTKKLHKTTWGYFVDVLGIKKVLSTERAKELDDQIETGKLEDGTPLPEITQETVFETLLGMIKQADEFSTEVILEAFDILTPGWDNYKTNCDWRIGKRVILSGFVNQHYDGWQLWSWHHSDKTQILNVLDRAFHLLDGKGIPEGYKGPLADTIQSIRGTNTGETEYFKFKCYKKGTLHLEFKRLDLLKELNRIAGEERPDLGSGK